MRKFETTNCIFPDSDKNHIQGCIHRRALHGYVHLLQREGLLSLCVLFFLTIKFKKKSSDQNSVNVLHSYVVTVKF